MSEQEIESKSNPSDSTKADQLNLEIDNKAQRRISKLEHELQQTCENLQALVEELETVNEEQEAFNKRLTISNEELHTVNLEYQSKILELTQVNNDIDNLLKSTDIGVIFLDRELKIRKFTPAATKAIALRNTDIERSLKELVYKIECPDLTELLEEVIKTKQAIKLEVKLKHSNSYLLMRINLYQTEERQDDGIVISFVQIDNLKQVQLQLSQTLKEKNRQLTALETASDGIAVLNDNKFIYLNQAHAEIFGYGKPEELIGKFWRVLYEPEELARFDREIFPILIEQGKWRGEVQAKHRYGHTFCAELTFSFTLQGDLICICRDVSEIKQARQQILQANSDLEQRVNERTQTLADFSDKLRQIHLIATNHYERLEDLFADYISIGCKIFELSTGIISQVEEGIYKVVAVQSSMEEVYIGFETPCQYTYCAEVIEKQQTVAYFDVNNIPQMQNHPVYLNFKLETFIGTPIFVNGMLYGTLNFSSVSLRGADFEPYEHEIIELMARDIGQSIATMQTKKALEKSENRCRNTFEQATVGIAHVSLEGRFLWVNRKLCDILGYTSQELMKLRFQDITYPEDLALDKKYVSQIIAGILSSCTYEKRYIRADGSVIWANLTFSLAILAQGESAHFIAIVEDISDRKQTELALAQSRQQLEQANQAKDDFIARISHELRTPLNSILGFSGVLQDELRLDSQKLHSVNIIHQSGQHLLTLINNILDFSKLNAQKSALEPQVFNLIQFLEEIASIFQLCAQQKGLNFKTQIFPSLPKAVCSDETKLRQVLFNLLSNAVKFTDVGSVMLKVGYVEEFEPHTPSPDNFYTRLKKIRFQVEDTGKGIPADELTEIFAPFRQSKSSSDQEGTGLGLTISQDIIQLMGGKIELTSNISQGTTFWFDLKLPLAETNLLPALSGSIFPTGGQLSFPVKILVVDDDDDNRFLLITYLELFGFILAEASNGKEGLEIAKTFQPDAILADLAMPVMDGKDMIAKVKQEPELENTVIITISANGQSILESSNVNCHAFLAKPVDLAQLLELLDNYLELDWQTEDLALETDLFTLVTPSQQKLNELLKLADIGDLEALESQINSLELSNSQYQAFAQEIRQFTNNFQQQKLENFIRNLIDR